MVTHSIIIPTYNRPRLLRRAVASAMTAIGASGEVIVVDDGSDTPAEETISDFACPRLTILRNPFTLAGGGSPSRNRGASAAKGGTLFFLDDDDEILPDYCANILRSAIGEGASFGFSARLFVRGSPERETETVIEKRKLQNGIIPSTALFHERTFPFSAAFWMLKETFHAIGPMETELKTNSDTEYCCRLYSSRRKGWYCAAPSVRVYDQRDSLGGEIDSVTRRTNSKERATAFRFIAEKHEQFLSQNPSAAAFVFSRLMKHSFRAGDKRQTVSAALRCTRARIRLLISHSSS